MLRDTRDYLLYKPNMLYRPRVSALMEKGMEHSLVSVIAGPGYGKTVAMTHFIKEVDRNLVWMRMVRLDNSTERFWRRFVIAVSREMPELGKELSQQDFPHTEEAMDHFASTFLKAVQSSGPVLMVMDSYECVRNKRIHSFFRMLVEVCVKDFCLFFLSNKRVNSAGIVRAERGHMRISMEDLRFTESEVAEIFRMNHMQVRKEDVQMICRQTEGWPLAIHYFSLQSDLQTRSLTEGTASQITLSAELFEQAYFSGYDKEMQTILIKLSLFESFSVEIIGAIAECDMQSVVDQLVLNMFIAYDYDLRIFTFQNMYLRFLTHKQAFLTPEEVRQVYAAAGKCFLRSGQLSEAMRCFWECGDYDALLHAVFELPERNLPADICATLLDYIRRMPKSYTADKPGVDYVKAFLHLNTLEIDKAMRLCEDLSARLQREGAQGEHRALLGETLLLQANLSFLQNLNNEYPLMEKAVECLPEGSRVYNQSLRMLQNNGLFYLPDGEPGRLEQMVKQMYPLAELSEKIMNGGSYGFEKMFAAEAAYLCKHQHEAVELCHQAIAKALTQNQHDIVCNAYYLMMRIGLYAGDAKQALSALNTLSAYVNRHPAPAMLDLLNCAESFHAIQMGDTEKVGYQINPALGEASRMGIGRNLDIYAYYLVTKRDYWEAQGVLLQMEGIFRQKRLWQSRLFRHILLAQCHLKVGAQAKAVESFRKAHDKAHANGIVTVFAEFGDEMCTLINAVRASGAEGLNEAWLDEVYSESEGYAKRIRTIKKMNKKDDSKHYLRSVTLTAREREVLNYMATGMTRNEIAAVLNISVNGVKKHITTIYTKLGAVNRADAMHIATLRKLI